MNEDKKICKETGKVCYTIREAKQTISLFKCHWIKKNKKIPVRYYKCEYCGFYHLTHYHNRYRNKPLENKKRERDWEEGVK